MTDVVHIFRSALSLLNPGARRRVLAIVGANVLVSLLDLLGLLLLVPFLSYVGIGWTPRGIAVEVARQFMPAASDERVVLVLALAAVVVFVVKGVASVTLLWVQTGILNRAQADLSSAVTHRFVKAPWLEQQDVDTGMLIRTATTSVQSVMVTIGAAVGVAAELAVFASVFIALVVVDVSLAFGAVLYLAAAGVLYLRVVRRAVERRGSEFQAESRRMNSALVELVGGVKELIVRDTAGAYVKRFARANRGYLAAYRVLWVSNMGMRYFLEALMITGVAAVIGVTPVITASPSSPVAGARVVLDASGSTVGSGRSIASYAWVLSAGSSRASFVTATNAAQATLDTTAAGSVTVQLTVTDDLGASASTTLTLTVQSSALAAAITATPSAPSAGDSVALQGSATTDSGRSVAAWSWSVVSGDASFSGGTSASSATLLVPSAGSVTVRLTVTDDQGLQTTADRTLTVSASTTSTSSGGGGAWSPLWALGLMVAGLALPRRRR